MVARVAANSDADAIGVEKMEVEELIATIEDLQCEIENIEDAKLSEMLGVSYETAWHLGHRIRAMMAEQNMLLSGLVEIDETYAGAPQRKRAKPEREDDDRDPPPPNPAASRDRVSLRVPAGLRRAIERACANRPGKVSINTWITEAISEKLDREEASKHRRASNG